MEVGGALTREAQHGVTHASPSVRYSLVGKLGKLRGIPGTPYQGTLGDIGVTPTHFTFWIGWDEFRANSGDAILNSRTGT
jgi:hypothetical protein